MRSAKEVGTVTAWPSPLSAPLRYAWASVYLSILVFCMKEWPQDQERQCTEGTQHTVWHSVSYYNSPCDLNNQNDHFSFPSLLPGIYEKSLQEHLKFPTLGCKFLLIIPSEDQTTFPPIFSEQPLVEAAFSMQLRAPWSAISTWYEAGCGLVSPPQKAGILPQEPRSLREKSSFLMFTKVYIKVQATSKRSELPDSRGIQVRPGTFLEGML